MKAFDAAYYDGRTARRHAVRVGVGPRGLRVRHEDGREVVWPYARVALAGGAFRGDPLRFELPGPEGLAEALVVEDAAILDAIGAANPEAALAFRKPSNVPAYVGKGLLAGVGVVAFAWGMVMWAVPALGGLAAMAVPTSWEDELGKDALTELVPSAERCTDAARVAAVQAIVDRLVKATGGTPYKYRVTIARDAAVNAFAAPGGYIVVNQGLLAKTRRPEELAGVLAHEVQHVERRHATQAICRELTMVTLLKAATAGATDAGAAIGAARTLGSLSHSRQAEEEADREGMRLLRAARFDPGGMVAAFQMLEAEGGDLPGALGYLSTHPRTADRVAKLKAAARVPGPPPVPVALDVPWSALTAGCE